MSTLEEVIKNKNVTWGELFRLEHCKDCCPLADSSFAYRKDETITADQVKILTTDSADWLAYALVSRPDRDLTASKQLTPEQKFNLIDEMKDDLYRHNAIRSVSFDSREAMRLINGTKNENGERVGGIKDEWWRYRALCNIKTLSSDQNFEIIDEFVNELYIMWAARDVDLRPQDDEHKIAEDELDRLESDRRIKLVSKLRNEEYICQSILEIEELDVKGSSKNRYNFACRLKREGSLTKLVKEAKCFSPEQLSELTRRAIAAKKGSDDAGYTSLPQKKGANPPGAKPVSEYVPKTIQEQSGEGYVALPKKKETPEKPAEKGPETKTKPLVEQPAEKPITSPEPEQTAAKTPFSQALKTVVPQSVAKKPAISKDPFKTSEKKLTDLTSASPKQPLPTESPIASAQEVQSTGKPFVATPYMPLTSATDTTTKTPQPISDTPKPVAILPPVAEEQRTIKQDVSSTTISAYPSATKTTAPQVPPKVEKKPAPKPFAYQPKQQPEKKPVAVIVSSQEPKGLDSFLAKWFPFLKK